MRKELSLLAVLLFVCTALFAQGDFKLSEQMFSRINQNPSAIGNNEKIQIFTAGRMQYVGMGLEQTPTSALLNAHYYNEKLKSGFGLSFTYDELGLYNQTINAKLCYAYNVDLFEGGLLSLGLSAGVVNKMFDPSRHVWRDTGDPLDGGEEITNTTAFDLDFGLEFSWKYLLVGASITHLPGITQDVRTTAAPTHINAYVRGNIYLPEKFNLIPAAAYTNIGACNTGKLISGDNAQVVSLGQEHLVDVSLTALYDGKYWLGVGYRLNTAVSFMAGFEWHWLRIGYCYDLSVGPVWDLTSSTHEVMLSFVIPTKKPVVW
ncbi:MAG: PorP/SprF family type IX secretion system membrane protein [Paludibacteraceae bacterium]|nr:PorP/SprF family type IX secretion system membrane protein [Paludibacteraceae bacterium]